MRAALTVWGRAAFPGARVVHELVVRDRRIDMAFIQEDTITGIEIKSARDKLGRLNDQVSAFRSSLPRVYVAIAPRWSEVVDHYALRVTRLVVDPASPVPVREERDWLKRDLSMTVQLLDLLWHAELTAIARRYDLMGRGRRNISVLKVLIARSLTGDEIVSEVCLELRARRAFPAVPESDPPIPVAPIHLLERE